MDVIQRGMELLKTLRPHHPRLRVSDEQVARVKAAIAGDPVPRRWYERLTTQAREILDQPPGRYVVNEKGVPAAKTMTRVFLHRVTLLAGLYRLNGDERYARRALAEILAAAAWPDWCADQFLRTAEMINGSAIGYDWLYPTISPADRATIREAIGRLGLRPGIRDFETNVWWTTCDFNWNQVCNGGLTAGALAIADEEPELAARVLGYTTQSLPLAMSTFSPEGAWYEGYWAFALQYNVYYLADLLLALGTDLGLLKTPGFAQTGFYGIHLVGPLGKTFNFADVPFDEPRGSAEMLWLARQFKQPVFAGHEIAVAGENASIMHLLWYDGPGQTPAQAAVPTDACYKSIGVAFLRSDWSDVNAMYVGVKGGKNKVNHSHLDLGSFVLDWLGHRWAVDLGRDDYSLPGYFGQNPLRWTYYRLRNEGHNTLTIDGQNQATDGVAPIVAFRSSPHRAFAIADLSDAYRGKVRRALRLIAMYNRKRILVQDEIEADAPVDVVWAMHTPAKISIAPGGGAAMLSQGSTRLTATILSPAGARFEVASDYPPPPQGQQPEIGKLVVRLASKVNEATVAVLIQRAGDVFLPKLEPLANWLAEPAAR